MEDENVEIEKGVVKDTEEVKVLVVAEVEWEVIEEKEVREV